MSSLPAWDSSTSQALSGVHVVVQNQDDTVLQRLVRACDETFLLKPQLTLESGANVFPVRRPHIQKHKCSFQGHGFPTPQQLKSSVFSRFNPHVASNTAIYEAVMRITSL